MTACGIRYSVFGIRYSVFGIRYSVFGIRYSVFGIRYSVNGDQTKNQLPAYTQEAGHLTSSICLVVLRFLWLRRVALDVGVRRSGAWHTKQTLHHHLWAGLAITDKRGDALAHVVLVEFVL